ncbi:MAG: A/G-specific adenine glycosylase [Sphingomonadales bacterium]
MPRRLLAWYDRHRRDLPWRANPGAAADPYAVWLSEIMLQQTTVAAVAPRFQEFLARWPTVAALAAAPDTDVLAAWAGLGYYARARNLLACARTVAQQFGGQFPDDEEALRRLPGIGRYTAAAVAAIAFGRPAVVVDGNVERVMARLFRVAQPLPAAKPQLHAHAASLTPRRRPGDYAQAVMDLGATICTPRAPQCPQCPWAYACQARQAGDAQRYPQKTPKPPRPQRQGVIFWLETDGAVLLCRRPAKGLLGGMTALPSSDWATGLEFKEALAQAPAEASWRLLPGAVEHVFTHFALTLRLAHAVLPGGPRPEGLWTPRDAVLEQGLPSVFAKAARHALRQL